MAARPHRLKSPAKKTSEVLQPPADWRRPLLLAAITLLVFCPVFAAKFTTWDDNLNVSKNAALNPPTFESIAHFWWDPYLDLYIPVTYTVWGVLAAIAQRAEPDASGYLLDPTLFHAANLLLHIAAVCVVFQILRRFGKWPAFAGALLFAIHPLQVESVAWITGMKDVLSGLLALTFIWQYLSFASCETRGKRRWHYALASIALVLALLSKPSAVVAPAIALLMDLFLFKRPWRKTLLEILPMLVVSAAWMGVSMWAQNVAAPADGGRIFLRPLIATDTLAFYLYKLFFPLRLGMQYQRDPATVIAHGWLYYTWIAPAALAATALLLRKKSPWLLLSAGIFALGVAPVLGLTPFAFQRYSTPADRYVYVAMLGPALALAAILARWRAGSEATGLSRSAREARGTAAARGFQEREQREEERPASGAAKREVSGSAQGRPRSSRATIAFVAIVFAALGAKSFSQCFVWLDSRRLFQNELIVDPRSFVAYDSLASELAEQDPDEAIRDAKKAVEYAPQRSEGYVTLGSLYMKNNAPQSVAMFRKAVEVDPTSAKGFALLGAALAQEKDNSEAEKFLRKAIQLNPLLAQAHLDLGILLKTERRYEEAFAQLQLAVRLDPGDALARSYYAWLLMMHGDQEQAFRQIRIALQIDPNLPLAVDLQRRFKQHIKME